MWVLLFHVCERERELETVFFFHRGIRKDRSELSLPEKMNGAKTAVFSGSGAMRRQARCARDLPSSTPKRVRF